MSSKFKLDEIGVKQWKLYCNNWLLGQSPLMGPVAAVLTSVAT